MTSSTVSLAVAPHEDLKREIVLHFWRIPVQETNIEDYASYFQYYHKSCEALYLGLRSEAKSLVSDNHNHVLIIVDVIWDFLDHNIPCTRQALRQALREEFTFLLIEDAYNEMRLNNSINLALRLWLTLDIRDAIFAPAASTIRWDDTLTLHDFIRSQFSNPRVWKGSSVNEEKQTVISDGELTAVKLRRIGGITTETTYHLNQHLRFDRELRKLKIFTLKTRLHDQRVCQAGIIPDAVINETILALRLLFPEWDPQSLKLLPCIGEAEYGGWPAFPDRVCLSDFYYWRDRLTQLCSEYESPPVSWRQIWTDRRNKLQWYTFWLAFIILILTIIFGMISSVTSCLQTIYAYEALQLAQRAEA